MNCAIVPHTQKLGDLCCARSIVQSKLASDTQIEGIKVALKLAHRHLLLLIDDCDDAPGITLLFLIISVRKAWAV